MIGKIQPTVEIEGFSGPFDLLARLVERRELDVLTISLAAVTEQYLDHLATLRLRDPEHLSAFLVVAAKLLLIKSSLLLPSPARPSSEGEPPDDPTDLTQRLQNYQAYRRAGLWLASREDAGLRSYPRPPVPYRPQIVVKPPPLDPSLLRAALERALSRPKPEPEPTPIASEQRLSVAEALSMLRRALEQYTTIRFGELVDTGEARQRYVAVFLAILEAIRQGIVKVDQAGQFGEIVISPRHPDPDSSDDDRRGPDQWISAEIST